MIHLLHHMGRGGLMVALVTLVAACASGNQAERAGQASPTAQPASSNQVASISNGAALPLHPAAGWHMRGIVRQLPATIDKRGVQVDVTAPAAELSRPDGGPNLLWHLGVGRCETTDRDAKAVFETIFYKHTPPVTGPGRLTFTMLPIPSPWDAQWRGSPLVLAAYVNGGGPFVACVNLPSGWGDPDS